MRSSYALLLRFTLIGLTVGFIGHQWGDYFIKQIIPIYEWMIKQLDYRLDTVEFSINGQNEEHLLMLETSITKPIFSATKIIVPDLPLPSAVGIPLGHALFPAIIMFTMVLSWPIKEKDAKFLIFLMRILLAIPLILLIMLIDIPSQLLKMVWDDLNNSLDINMSNDLPALTLWSDFLNGGGLIALSITAGILVLAIVESFIHSEYRR